MIQLAVIGLVVVVVVNALFLWLLLAACDLVEESDD